MNYAKRSSNFGVRSAKCELRGSLSKRAFLWFLTVNINSLTISNLQLILSLYGVTIIEVLAKENTLYACKNRDLYWKKQMNSAKFICNDNEDEKLYYLLFDYLQITI